MFPPKIPLFSLCLIGVDNEENSNGSGMENGSQRDDDVSLENIHIYFGF